MADKDEDKQKEDATRAALASAAEDKDEAKAAKAKRALAAYDSDEDDEKKKEEEAKAAAEAAAAAAAASAAAQASAVTLQEVAAELASLKAERAAAERATLFASRPDLPASVTAPLKDLPIAKAKAILDGIPKIVNPKAPAATASAAVGAEGVIPPAGVDQAFLARLDQAFGTVAKTQPGVVVTGAVQQFGVPVPVVAGGNAQ